MKEYTDLEGKYFDEVLLLVKEENLKQLETWGVQKHSLPMWYLITGEEFGEVAKSILEEEVLGQRKTEIIQECIQTITLLMKIVEMVRNDIND